MISSGTIMKNAPTDIFDLSMAHTNDTPPPPKKKECHFEVYTVRMVKTI